MFLPSNVKMIIEKLEKSGFQAYVVGGCVRDSVMGNEPKDWDITTSALPEQTALVFSSFRLIMQGVKHGTVGVVVDGEVYEITTMRCDGEYTDSRRPENVSFVKNINEDLKRRDFTVNALAFNEKTGVVDISGGMEDIKNKIIRTVGDADTRFSEDALRIMRCLRFASVLGFSIEEKTSLSVRKNKELLRNIAVERINVEFTKLICGDNALKIIDEYKDVIDVFIEDFSTISREDMAHACSLEKEADVRLCALLHSFGEQKARDVLVSLRYPKKTINLVCSLIEHYNYPCHDLPRTRFLVGKLGADTVLKLSHLRRDKQAASFVEQILQENLCCTISQLDITGAELKEIGIHGRKTGTVLEKMLKFVIEEKLENEKNTLLEFAETCK